MSRGVYFQPLFRTITGIYTSHGTQPVLNIMYFDLRADSFQSSLSSRYHSNSLVVQQFLSHSLNR